MAAQPRPPSQPFDETNMPLPGDDAEVDPALAEKMQADAEKAAERGASDALLEAQAAAAQQQAQEAAEDQADQTAQPAYDLGEEFGIGSTKAAGEPSHQRTFLTGVDNASQANLAQPAAAATADDQPFDQGERMSDEELIAHVEQQMMEYERCAQYLEAEKARQHLASLKKRFMARRRDDLDKIQQEDVAVFFAMVAQHQENFDRTWSKKTLEHKLRADDLIDALKWKHEDGQRELYETLRRKRMPKFSVELLNMRKRQVLLARSKHYISAEKVKRKGDILEAIEIDRIREAAKEENQLRFQALLQKQEWERKQLAAKLKLEKKCLLEAKAQDFLRLKKRLRNAEQELKKTHVRQQLLAEKKILPLHSYNQEEAKTRPTGRDSARGSVLRNTGMQRMMASTGGGGASPAHANKPPPPPPMRSARDLARTGRDSATGSISGQHSARGSARTGQSIIGSASSRPPLAYTMREEKDVY